MEAGKPTVVTSRLRQLTSDLQQVAAGLSSAAFSGQGPQAAKQPGEQREEDVIDAEFIRKP
jgi:hypothetical protein